MTRKNPIGYKNQTWNLKTFLTISLGIHLSISILLILIPDLRIEKFRTFHMEVSLLPVIAVEKPSTRIILPKLKTELKKQLNRLLDPEKREEPLLQKELEPEPSYPEQIVEESEPTNKHKKVEKTVKEPLPATEVVSSPEEKNPWSSQMASVSPPVYTAFGSNAPDEIAFSNNGYQKESVSVSKPPPSEDNIPFIQPRYASNPKSFYPQEARKKGYQGEVILKVEVLADGRVGQVEVKKSSGYELLDRSASATVKEWKFIPAKKGEKAIPFLVNIPIKYQLQ